MFGVMLLALIFVGSGLPATRVCAAPPSASNAGFPAYPLKVSDNRRYLVDQNNIPFLIAGDVPQPMVRMVSTAEAASYLDDRQAHGFNAMWIDVLVAGPYYPDSRKTAAPMTASSPSPATLPAEKTSPL